jgi:uncharacterized protein (TIGR03083 family)
MTSDQYLAAIAADSQGFADAAAAVDLRTAVPACPGWDVGDLVWHLLGVHHFWATIAAERLQAPDEVDEPERPGDDEIVEVFRRGAERLVDVLRAADPATPVWTWAPQKDVAFIARHQAQETAVHRWDAEAAAGRSYSIDPEIAADSIDEFLEMSAPSANDDAAALGGTVHLHCTDTPGEWFIQPTADGAGLHVTAEHAKGDVALRGTASDLLLALYRRQPIDTVDVIGDRGVGERFLARTNLE